MAEFKAVAPLRMDAKKNFVNLKEQIEDLITTAITILNQNLAKKKEAFDYLRKAKKLIKRL